MAKDWKVVTFDTTKKVPLYEEWDVVRQGPIQGTVMVELHELTDEDMTIFPGTRDEKVVKRPRCVKRRYYPLLSIIYIEEMGLEKA